MEVVIDSGADISVAPSRLRAHGTPTAKTGIIMQDAQGKQIAELDTRILEVGVRTLAGERKLPSASVSPLRRFDPASSPWEGFLRAGWTLGGGAGQPTISRGPHEVPIRLRRNTLVMTAAISEVRASGEDEDRNGQDQGGANQNRPEPRRGVNNDDFRRHWASSP